MKKLIFTIGSRHLLGGLILAGWITLNFGSSASRSRAASVPDMTASLACAGTRSVAKFELLVKPPQKGAAIPIRQINQLEPGDKLLYEPISMPDEDRGRARVAVILAHAGRTGSEDVKVLEAIPAAQGGQWEVPIRASVVGVVYGPHGLNVKSVNSLVTKNPKIIPELATYAERSTEVEVLVNALQTYEQSPSGTGDLNAALAGFSTRFGVGAVKLDSTAPANQQAAVLLTAIVPSLNSFDPLGANRTTLVSEEVGLASAVAGMFFGSPVVLAAGGAALFQNMRTLAFPGTDFHSAFAQSGSGDDVELCSKPQPQKSRMRPAYLWMVRVPDTAAPAISLPANARIPIGMKSGVRLSGKRASDLRLVSRAAHWRLVSEAAGVPATVAVENSGDQLQLDLTNAKIQPGRYRLVADWDWTPIEIPGVLDLRSFADFKSVRLAPESADRLIAGSGKAHVSLGGADFEFVTKVALDAGNDGGQPLNFTVPKAADEGSWDSLDAEVDTSKLSPGIYRVELTQSNGDTQSVPVTVHAPNPYLENLPLRANLGESVQKLQLSGSGLDRIEKITSAGATWDLDPAAAGSANPFSREAVIKLASSVHPGDRLDAEMSVAGIAQPINIPNAIEVAGPRPRIVSAEPSFPQVAGDSLRAGELPSGLALSFSIRTQNAGDQPALELACSNSTETVSALKLHVASTDPRFQLDRTGDDALFLSFDPASVGRSGCQLAATVSSAEAGVSNPYPLGRVVRLPRVEKFSLSDREIGRKLYAGTVTGEDLQLIERTGWNEKHGYPVQGIPTPLSSDPAQQTLDIALPWPPPSPQAPLYVWLRGENDARRTGARY